MSTSDFRRSVLIGLLLLGAALALIGALAMPAAQAGMIAVDSYRGLSADRHGHGVGDMLTVLVVESTSAHAAAGTGASSKTGVGFGAGFDASSIQANLGLQGDSDGRGQTSRSGQVRTNVSVRIVEARSDGMLRIEGEREVSINDEKEHIHVSGWVRPDDIAYDNTVLSYRLADARIDISGDGVVSSAQRQSVVFRFLKWLHIL